MVKELSSQYYTIHGEQTGIYRRDAFLQEVEERCRNIDNKQNYCIAAIDIEYFKLFNEWFGLEAGDRFLLGIAQILEAVQERFDAVAGYMFGDDFAVFLPHDKTCLQEINEQIIAKMRTFDADGGFYPIIGVYVLTPQDPLPAAIMYDKACFAHAQVQGNMMKRIAYYEQALQDKLAYDHKIIHGLYKVLEAGDIIYYLQPKCDLQTGKIVGAEALVRWREDDGQGEMIPPDLFIPVLERTGLISKVDAAVWEAVCRDLRKWIDAGKKPLPISVNLSRKDIYIIDVVTMLTNIADRYQIPHELLEVEITESTYSEDYEQIRHILTQLKEAGFLTSMDDFGSGYSSLNMLKDVNVDLLKIDMQFLKFNEDSYLKGAGIIETIINMAKVLEIPVIAEGVENEKQLRVLADIGCRYVQGYYYYRPMPAKDFYTLIQDEKKIDTRGMQAVMGEYISLEELLNNQLLSSTLLDRMLGAFAFIEYDGTSLYRIKANESYYEIVNGGQVQNIRIMRKQRLRESVHPADWDNLISAFAQACEYPLASSKVIYRGQYSPGEYRWYMASINFLKDNEKSKVCIAQVTDISDQIEKEQDLKIFRKTLREVIHISEDDRDFMKLSEDKQRLAFSLYSKVLPVGMIGGYCEPGYPVFFISNEIMSMLGYDSYEMFVESIHGLVENTIYVDDRSRVLAEVGTDWYEGMEYTTTYRMVRKDGSMFWTLDRGNIIKTEDDRLAVLSFCVDITEIMERQYELTERIKPLIEQQKLEAILNMTATNYWEWNEQRHEIVIQAIDGNDKIMQFFGFHDLGRHVLGNYPEWLLHQNWVTAENAQRYIQFLHDALKQEEVSHMEWCLMDEDGNENWQEIFCRPVQDMDNSRNLIGYYRDITEQKLLARKNLMKLIENDALTGLYNRYALLNITKGLFRDSKRECAFVMVDMDNFKQANDVLGHAFGDSLLVETARILKSVFGEKNPAARIGGDEFCAVCLDITEEQVDAMLQELLRRLERHIEVGNRDLIFTASAGYAMKPKHGNDFATLYEKADAAMFHAKLSGKNSYRGYDSSMKQIREELIDEK